MKGFSENLGILLEFVSGSSLILQKLSMIFQSKQDYSKLAAFSSNILTEYFKVAETFKPLAYTLDLNFIKCQENLNRFSHEVRDYCLEFSRFVDQEVLDVEETAKEFAKRINIQISEFFWTEDESCAVEPGILRFSSFNYLDAEPFALNSDCKEGNCESFQHFFKIFEFYAKVLAKCKQVLRVFTIFQISSERHFKVLESIVFLILQSSRTEKIHEKLEKKLQVLSNFDGKIRKSFNKILDFSKNFLNCLEELPNVDCFSFNLFPIKQFLGERLKNVLNCFKSWTDKLELFHKSESFSPRKLSIDSQSSSTISSRSIFNYFNLRFQIDSKIAKETLTKNVNVLISALSKNYPEAYPEIQESLRNLNHFFSLYQDSGVNFIKNIEIKARGKEILMKNFSVKYAATIKSMKPKPDKFLGYRKVLCRTRSTQRELNDTRKEFRDDSKGLESDRKSFSLVRKTQSNLTRMNLRHDQNWKSGETVLNRISSFTQNLSSRLSGKFLHSSHIRKMQKKEVYMMSFR